MKSQLWVLLASIAVLGCIGIRQYRTLPPEDRCEASEVGECPAHSYFVVEPDIHLAIIEFDDQGVLHDAGLKDLVMAELRGLARDGAMVIVYAHGWDNDASAKSPALNNFQGVLREIAQADRTMCTARPCAGRNVVGVYLAWRGKSARFQPLGVLTFWGRKGRAHRIGQDGATEVLAELAEIVEDARQAKPRGKKRVDQLIVVGHSFGGALIFDATQQLLMKDMVSQRAMMTEDDERLEKRSGGQRSARQLERLSLMVPTTIADLVILVNPALEAARLTPLYERADRMEFSERQRPILAVFTSRKDWPNRRFFPVGRSFSTFLKSYNPGRRGQAQIDRTAIGHYRDYQTHDLELKNGSESRAAGSDAICAWERFRRRQTPAWDVGDMLLERRAADQPIIPYYNIWVDPRIIRGHHQIWDSEPFRRFISLLVAVQTGPPCDAYRKR